MKLYYMPAACSLAPHIALREAGLPFDLERVDQSKKTRSGEDYLSINPKGSVPAVKLDDGQVLTEAAVIQQYIADRVPAKKLAPENGSLPRYRLQEWLNYVTSELHKGYGALFSPTTPEDYKPVARERLTQRYELVDSTLQKQPYLLGSAFSVADPYLFVVTNWAPHLGVNLDRFKALQAFQGRMRERPTVMAALKAEGLS